MGNSDGKCVGIGIVGMRDRPFFRMQKPSSLNSRRNFQSGEASRGLNLDCEIHRIAAHEAQDWVDPCEAASSVGADTVNTFFFGLFVFFFGGKK